MFDLYIDLLGPYPSPLAKKKSRSRFKVKVENKKNNLFDP